MMEKKIKSSAEKITMSDEAKKRILRRCAEIENAENLGNTEYTDHVFTVERVKPKSISRIIAAVAACAVIAGGVCTAGVIIHRSADSQLRSEITEEMSNNISPFGDFRTLPYFFGADGKNGMYSPETYEKLSNFLNNFNWGEETAASDSISQVKYAATWFEGEDIWFSLIFREDGNVVFTKTDLSQLVDDPSEIKPEFKKNYCIDFNEFDRGVQEIIAPDRYAEDEMLPSLREEIRSELLQAVNNDDISIRLNYTNDRIPKDERPDNLKVKTRLTDDMLRRFADWIYENTTEISPNFSLGDEPQVLDIFMMRKIKPTDEEYYTENYYAESYDGLLGEFSFYEDGTFVWSSLKPMLDSESDERIMHSSLFFKADYRDLLRVLSSEEEYSSENSNADYEEMTAPLLNEENKKIYHSEDGDITMNSAMCHALCDALEKSESTGEQTGDEEMLRAKGLFSIESDTAEYKYELIACTDNIIAFRYVYNNNGHEADKMAYRLFKCDTLAVKKAIESAADTEKKHTEDNAAYYLPGFNFEKLCVTGDEEMDRKLQDIFYGYDYTAHEVTNVDTDSLEVVYTFAVAIGGEKDNYKRVLKVCRDGYIYLYDTDKDGKHIHADDEKIYKFDSDDILNALSEIYGAEADTVQESEEMPELIKGKTMTCHTKGDDKTIVLSEQQKMYVWYIFEKYDWTDMRLAEKDQSVCGDIKYYIDCYDENKENFAIFTMNITDKGYIIIDNPNKLQQYDDFFKTDGRYTIYDASNNCLIGSFEDVISER